MTPSDVLAGPQVVRAQTDSLRCRCRANSSPTLERQAYWNRCHDAGIAQPLEGEDIATEYWLGRAPLDEHRWV